MHALRCSRVVMHRSARSTCIRLMGGLGNQLFQYGFGVRLGNSGDEVCFDLENGFHHDSYGRTYSLQKFYAEVRASPASTIPTGMSWRPPFHRLAKLFWSLSPKSLRAVFYEKSPFGYDPVAIDSSGSHRYYFGYWQHPSYLQPARSRLRKELRLRHESDAFRAVWEEMRRVDSVSVHVRRYHDLDKAGNVILKARKTHGSCDPGYYARALKLIPNASELKVFVFTDCIEWSRQYVQLGIDCRYVADLGTFSDAEEMVLMSACRHHIISNSSFGWWGAWLGDNPRKIVVAPKEWNKSFSGDQTGVCPAEWVRT